MRWVRRQPRCSLRQAGQPLHDRGRVPRAHSHVAAARTPGPPMAAPRPTSASARGLLRLVLGVLVLGAAHPALAFELSHEEAALCANRRPAARSSCVQAEWQRCLNANLSTPGACRGAATPCGTTNPRWAWATLVNGNSANYTSMALVQVLSARMFSCYKHITLVTPEVNQHVRGLLTAAGSVVREVERVVWAKEPPGVIDNYRWLMTKLQLWRPNVTGHDRVAFIDADIFLLSPRADGLFERCSDPRTDLCAAAEQNNPTINGGTLVVRPSETRYQRLLRELDTFEKPNAIYPDMAFISHHYRMRRHLTSPLKANRSDFLSAAGLELFNLRKEDGKRFPSVYHTCPGFSRLAFAPFQLARERVRRSLSKFELWHACGRHKLERHPMCAGAAQDRRNDVPLCDYRVLRLFQWIYRQANPCSAHGVSATDCASASSGCQWCSDHVRCVPSSWSCGKGDLATRALESRMTMRKSTLRPGWCSLTCDPVCCEALRKKKKGWSAAAPGER